MTAKGQPHADPSDPPAQHERRHSDGQGLAATIGGGGHEAKPAQHEEQSAEQERKSRYIVEPAARRLDQQAIGGTVDLHLLRALSGHPSGSGRLALGFRDCHGWSRCSRWRHSHRPQRQLPTRPEPRPPARLPVHRSDPTPALPTRWRHRPSRTGTPPMHRAEPFECRWRVEWRGATANIGPAPTRAAAIGPGLPAPRARLPSGAGVPPSPARPRGVPRPARYQTRPSCRGRRKPRGGPAAWISDRTRFADSSTSGSQTLARSSFVDRPVEARRRGVGRVLRVRSRLASTIDRLRWRGRAFRRPSHSRTCIAGRRGSPGRARRGIFDRPVCVSERRSITKRATGSRGPASWADRSIG